MVRHGFDQTATKENCEIISSDIAQEDEIEDLTSRVHRVEKKVGLTQ